MIRHIINARLRFHQLRPLRMTDSNRKSIRLGRAVNGWTRQEFSEHLQRGSAVNRALFDTGQFKCNLPDDIKGYRLSWHKVWRRLRPNVLMFRCDGWRASCASRRGDKRTRRIR